MPVRFRPVRRHFMVVAVAACLGCLAGGANAQTVIPIPNGSFELPTAGEPVYADMRIDSWQKTAPPVGYDTNVFGSWEEKTGVFRNVPFPQPIDNVDGFQAAFLFSFPGVGFFQDYDSIGGTNSEPSYAFDPTYQVGRSYRLTAGFTTSTFENLPEGATISMRLYCREASTNRVVIAERTVTYSTNTFTNPYHLLDYHLDLPTVQTNDAWAGKHVGIEFVSNVPFELIGGVWDVDNVRLLEFPGPRLLAPELVDGQFQFSLTSEIGAVLEILSTTNVALSVTNWSVMETLTNLAGTLQIIDASPLSDRRYYTARQLE